MEQKEWQITDEIKDMFDKHAALLECRDRCIMLVFRSRSAISYANQAVKIRNEAWRKVFELYPELKGNKLSYDNTFQTITVKGKEQ